MNNIYQLPNSSTTNTLQSQFIESQMIQQIIDMGIDFYTALSPDKEVLYTSNREGCISYIKQLGYDLLITYPTEYGWCVNALCNLGNEHEFQLHQNDIGNGL